MGGSSLGVGTASVGPARHPPIEYRRSGDDQA